MSRRGLAAAGIGLLALAVSANVLANGFVYDDVYNIVQNPWIRDWRRVGEAFVRHVAGFDAALQTSYYRPLMHVLYAATHAAAGPAPWAFHLVALLLHVAVCVCVFALAARWSGLGAALAAGALFAVHPIHAEVVAWNAGVTDSSYALLGLLALLVALRPGRVRFVAAPLLLFGALLCKEPGIMFAPVILVALWSEGRWRTERREVLVLGAGFAFVSALYLALRLHALAGWTGGDRRVKVGLADGAATAIALFGEEVRRLFAPAPLNVIHTMDVVSSPADAGFLFGAAVAAAVAVLAWKAVRHPALAPGLALLVLPLGPTLYVPALGEGLFAERYLYVPSAGAALLLALAWDRLPRRLVPAAAAGSALVVAAGATATVARNAEWRTNLTLWERACAVAPGSPAAQEAYAFALLEAGRAADAVPRLRRVLADQPDRFNARVNLALALQRVGRSEEALAEARRAAAGKDAQSASAQAVLGWLLTEAGEHAEAVAALRRARALNPASAEAANSLGVALARLGDMRGAVEEFCRAAGLDPGRADYARNAQLAGGCR